MVLRVSLRTLLASGALAALFATAPVHFGKWDLSLGWNAALADGDSGSSGSGGGDNSGSGSGNDDADEPDGGDDDNSGSGGGGGDDPDDQDQGEDRGENGGTSNPDDNNGGDSSGSSNSGANGSNWFLLPDGTRVEISNGGGEIKLIYANGWREEIRSGRYVLRDEENRLVVDRAVTEDDYARLQGLLSS